jgi:hypothetical protein
MTTDDLKPDDSLLEPLKESLSKKIEEEDWKEEEVLSLAKDDNFLRRCLLARLNDEKKATAMAVQCLKFREKVKPSKLTVADFKTANDQQVYSFAGHTKNGWPIIHCKAKNWNPWAYGVEEYVKELAFLFEQAERGMDPSDPFGRFFVVMDMKGMSKLNSDLGKLRQLVKVTCEMYPERLGFGITCNADFLTWFLWKFIAPLMDQRSRERIKMFMSDYHEFLEEQVGMENVGPALGGGRKEEWPPIEEANQHDLKWNGDTVKRQETGESEISASSEAADQHA